MAPLSFPLKLKEIGTRAELARRLGGRVASPRGREARPLGDESGGRGSSRERIGRQCPLLGRCV